MASISRISAILTLITMRQGSFEEASKAVGKRREGGCGIQHGGAVQGVQLSAACKPHPLCPSEGESQSHSLAVETHISYIFGALNIRPSG